jgi:hypothetical protein
LHLRNRRERLLTAVSIAPGEILILAVDAIDRTWGPTPRRHERVPTQSSLSTQATGSEDGEISRFRSRTCGGEAPRDRLDNRTAASQGTHLCVLGE